MKTFDKITKTLRKTITQLKALHTYNEQQAGVKTDKAARLYEEITTLDEEGDRAQKTAEKLEALIAA